MEIVEIARELFENSDIRILGTNDAPLFVANDVGKILGINKISASIKDYDEDEKVLDLVKTRGGDQRMTVLTEKGLRRVIATTRSPSAVQIKDKLNKIYYPTVKEAKFIDSIKRAFPNESFILQKQVENYKIDAYMPKYNLSIEFDENAHKYRLDNDIKRQECIERELKCSFIRISENMDIIDAIGLINTKIYYGK